MNRRSGLAEYSPSAPGVIAGATDVPWPWSGMNGVTVMGAPEIGAPLPSVTRRVQVFAPRAGGAGSLATSSTWSTPSCA